MSTTLLVHGGQETAPAPAPITVEGHQGESYSLFPESPNANNMLWAHADMTLMAFSCTNIDQPEKSWSVQIMANGDVELSPDFTFTEAARQFWAAVEFKGKSLLRRAEDAEARLQALEGK